MTASIRLFKGVLVKNKKKATPSLDLFVRTIQYGVVLAPEVLANYTGADLDRLVQVVIKEVGMSALQMNSTFHKSWQKVQDASLEQLIVEQLWHYVTTYGFRALGIHDQGLIYIPDEVLDIPGLKIDRLPLIVIKGYTKDEFKEKLIQLLASGVALSEETVHDVVDLVTYLEIAEPELALIKNKEVRTALYDKLGLVPAAATEFLRLLLYKSTGNTLLIQNQQTIKLIKSKDNRDIVNTISKYEQRHGLRKLAEIFYRFRLLFLAFRTNPELKKSINKIRRLAKKYHVPMKEDYLNQVTATLKQGKSIDPIELKSELEKVNAFRKIRLAYSLKYRTTDPESTLYRIRNGKGYATEFTFPSSVRVEPTLDVVIQAIIEDLTPNVEGKTIYIPEEIIYALPSTEKMFTGNLPSGTHIIVPSDAIIGIHWKDTKSQEVDLDLALVGSEGKLGWDTIYRTDSRDMLFSGDITEAPEPEGASEMFYIKQSTMKVFAITVNFYNRRREASAPFSIFVAQEHVSDLNKNYMIDPNNIKCRTRTKITEKQLVLGLLTTDPTGSIVYFAETHIGNTITSDMSDHLKHTLNYLKDFYINTISLNDLLIMAGAVVTHEKSQIETCDINLSPEIVEKDTILRLFRKNVEK